MIRIALRPIPSPQRISMEIATSVGVAITGTAGNGIGKILTGEEGTPVSGLKRMVIGRRKDSTTGV